MKLLSLGLILLGVSACKKSNFSGNLGTCKSVYETTSTSIIIDEDSTATFCLLEGFTYKIDITSLNLSNIEWNTGDSTNLISINEPGTYEGNGINNNNDTISFTFDAINCIENIYIPNVFTPNGDARNDNWQPKFAYSTICEGNYQLSIFNTYHQLIFNTNKANLAWDGTYKGVSSPQGVYHYIIQYKREDGEAFEKKGQLFLMR